MGSKSVRCVIPASRPSEEASILSSIATGERVTLYETVGLHKAGRAIDASVTTSPIRDPDGRVIGASDIVRDTKRSESRRFMAPSACEGRPLTRGADCNFSSVEGFWK